MNNFELETIAYLRSPHAIRQQCDRVFQLGQQNQLKYFQLDLSQLEKTADYVIKIIEQDYPTLEIPFHSRWRHFEIDNIPRIQELDQALAPLSAIDRAKSKFDLVIISVLLDAGAGQNWQYYEKESGNTYHRSEGLAISTFRMFCQGYFSSNPDFPYQVDAQKLEKMTLEKLAQGFQISSENQIIGLEGRLKLLQNLGRVLREYPLLFSNDENPRPGYLARHLQETRFSGLKTIRASEVLNAILKGFGEIWPGSLELFGVKLGDIGKYSPLKSDNITEEYIPFHKLSQWLTYSLLEPLKEMGLEVIDLEELTGLPEYRNGGLCIDMGLLKIKDTNLLSRSHLPHAEIIVEWRGLTVILLDKIAEIIRQKLSLNESELPMVKILQGGTWQAGRKIAQELRQRGIPPLEIESDGTVF
ncbi:MAG: URC4/urg3 family protein [Microcoleaceae cyanobacterium]